MNTSANENLNIAKMRLILSKDSTNRMQNIEIFSNVLLRRSLFYLKTLIFSNGKRVVEEFVQHVEICFTAYLSNKTLIISNL